MTKHLDKEQNILYFQNYGGSLGLGLLLGPLGVAANVGIIESNTKKDVEQLRDKISVRPTDIFSEVAKREGLDLSSVAETAQKPKVTPYLYVSKTDGETLLLSSSLLVEQGEGTGKWIGKYMYQLPVKYSISELSQLSPAATTQLKEAMATGFAQIILNLRAENPEQLAQEKKIIFKSDLLAPNISFDMIGRLISEDNSVVWIRTVGGVFAIQKTNITFTVQKS